MGIRYCPHCDAELREDTRLWVLYCIECEFILPIERRRKIRPVRQRARAARPRLRG